MSAPDMGSMNTTPFDLEEDFPAVIISYCTKTSGGLGKDLMWAVANVLRENGITSFNGYQVQLGEETKGERKGKAQ